MLFRVPSELTVLIGGNRLRKLALAVVLLAALATSSRAQSSTAPSERPKFDTISVKVSNSDDPGGALQLQNGGRLVATNMPLRPVFALAYNVALSQGRGAIFGAPDWFESKRFDIEAKADGDTPRDQMILMLQSLLADRFKLAVHRETRQLPIYALVLTRPGKTGPQLKSHSENAKCISVAQPDPGPGNDMPAYCGDYRIGAAAGGGRRETANAIAMDRFSASIAQQVDRPIVDRTELRGVFDLELEFMPQHFTDLGSAADAALDPSAPPSLFTALQEQLGLKLEPQTGPVEVFVIDHVEEPSAN